MKHLLLILFIYLAQAPLFAQKIKFGNIPKDQLELQACPYDESAGAVVLSDVGNAWMDFTASGQLRVIAERHVRIKIFNQAGYDFADVELPFYVGYGTNGNDASITSLKAHTIVPNGGKYEEFKVDKSAIFEEETRAYFKTIKFSFPKVDDGVIVEYKYRLMSPFFQPLRSWEFQRSIPVLFSKFESTIPEFFDCSATVIGHNSQAIKYDKTTRNTTDWLNNVHQFEGTNLPAIKGEKYGTNVQNYTTKARILIRSYHFPGAFVQTVGGDYNEFNKTLLEYDRYHQLNQGLKFLDAEVESIERSDDKMQYMTNIVNYVKNKVNYNEFRSSYPNVSIKETMNNVSSNSAAINMYLVALLQHAGFAAEPLILGTRDYLRPHPFNPDRSDFNYLAAYVTHENEKTYVLDATSQVDGGNPEINLMNADGWIISASNGRKVNLTKIGEAKVIVKTDMTINPGDKSNTSCEIKCNYLGLHALTGKYNGDQHEAWLNAEVDQKVENYTFEASPSMSNMKYEIEGGDVSNKDIIYVQPEVTGMLDYEVFRSTGRQTPLDFPYQRNVTNIVSIKIPDGYVLESVPESKKLMMGDNAMKFSYLVSPQEDAVMINVRFKLIQNFYLQDTYADVRAFVGEVESILNEKIVFKKGE